MILAYSCLHFLYKQLQILNNNNNNNNNKYSYEFLVQWCSAYFIFVYLVGYLECFHGAYHRVHGHVDILIDELDVRSLVLVRVAGAVDDAHLFDERGLARLAGAEQQQLELFSLIALVLLDLTLDLLIDAALLARLCRHTASHRCSRASPPFLFILVFFFFFLLVGLPMCYWLVATF